MCIFVTGGAGYIGSHTVLELLKQGYNVVAADNFSNSKPEAIYRMRKLSGIDFPFYDIDIRDSDKLDEIFRKYQITSIIHFAGAKAIGESVLKPIKYYTNNLNSTLELCKAMERHNVTNIVFSSSASVYSGDNEMPLSENSGTGNCINPYSWTKYMCEQILRDTAHANKNWSVILLRYFNPIGAHESGMIGEDPQDIPNNLMPVLTQVAVGKLPILYVYGDDYDTHDGTCIRDYIHVSDLAAGHAAAVEYMSKNRGVNVFNLGTGRGVSVFELINAFEEASGIILPKKITSRRAGDLPVTYANPSRAKEILGWVAKKTLLEGCMDSWNWQKNNPDGYE